MPSTTMTTTLTIIYFTVFNIIFSIGHGAVLTSTPTIPNQLSITIENRAQTTANFTYNLTYSDNGELIMGNEFRLKLLKIILNNQTVETRVLTDDDANGTAGEFNGRFDLNDLKPNESYTLRVNVTMSVTTENGTQTSVDLESSNYLTVRTLSRPCPCLLDRSTGECEFGVNDTMYRCVKCLQSYTGDKCTECEATSFKTSNGTCVTCNCNGNVDTVNGTMRMCSDTTGACLNCKNNTAGMNCEKCAGGYVRDTLTNGCVTQTTVTTESSTSTRSSTTLASSTPSHIDLPSTSTKRPGDRNFYLFTLFVFVMLFIVLTFSYYFYNLRVRAGGNGGGNGMGGSLTYRESCLNLFENIRERFRSYNTNRRANQFLRAQFDDDRLNLAENQILDDDEFYFSTTPTSQTAAQHNRIFINNQNSSPYRTLTIQN